MALFREHRGGLKESLLTTKIVKNKKELLELIKEMPLLCNLVYSFTNDDIVINPYPYKDENFDDRIGWYTNIVLLKLSSSTQVIGFLSEPLE